MIKTALLIITMSGHGIVYENPYSTMKQCLADKTAVAEQINDRYGVSSIDVLCVPFYCFCFFTGSIYCVVNHR